MLRSGRSTSRIPKHHLQEEPPSPRRLAGTKGSEEATSRTARTRPSVLDLVFRPPQSFYATTFIILLPVLFPLFIPFFVFPSGGTQTPYDTAMVVSLVLNTAILAFVWNPYSLPGCSFRDGRKAISSRNMSGCANITIIYIYPLLFFVYMAGLYYSLVGIFRGASYRRDDGSALPSQGRYANLLPPGTSSLGLLSGRGRSRYNILPRTLATRPQTTESLVIDGGAPTALSGS